MCYRDVLLLFIFLLWHTFKHTLGLIAFDYFVCCNKVYLNPNRATFYTVFTFFFSFFFPPQQLAQQVLLISSSDLQTLPVYMHFSYTSLFCSIFLIVTMMGRAWAICVNTAACSLYPGHMWPGDNTRVQYPTTGSAWTRFFKAEYVILLMKADLKY